MYSDKTEISLDCNTNRITNLPIGVFKKKLIGNKYVNVIELDKHLLDSSNITEGISDECKFNSSITDDCQLHFTFGMFDGDSDMLTAEMGNFMTFEEMYRNNPQLVSDDMFLKKMIFHLADFISILNENDVFHICLSPSTIIFRKGENTPILISHGSFYLKYYNQKQLYQNQVDFVAPEVLESNTADKRSDVYSMGKFMEYLYSYKPMPLSYKKIISKATQSNPEDRYATLPEMIKDIKKKNKIFKTISSFIISIICGLVCLGVYIRLMPESNQIEYVTPVSNTENNDILNNGFDAVSEYGYADTLQDFIDKEDVKLYQSKCEEIFRKKYTVEAERILAKIYNTNNTGTNIGNFISGSQTHINELINIRNKIAAEAGLEESKSHRIATEVIDKITTEKQKKIIKNGIQK